MGRVESYRQFRPQYPDAVVALLESECGLTADSTIADIAAGTGLLAEVFLARRFKVVAVEPNEEMRVACESLVAQYPRLRCVGGSAEATGLPSHSFDLITVGQALHWFDLSHAGRVLQNPATGSLVRGDLQRAPSEWRWLPRWI